jgi:trans-aconitate 2-methyltransferase
VADRLPLAGDEWVLDAGCGTGRVTEILLERLPEGRLVAVDASPAMAAAARARLDPRRAHVVAADLARPLPLARPVDAVLSTAVFHWIPDHEALYRNLAAAMRPGARLEAQCGGVGNIAALLAAARRAHPGWEEPRVLFAGPDETSARLESAGFTDVRAWLAPEPTPFEDRDLFEDFIATVCFGVQLRNRSARERAAFVRGVANEMTRLEIDYVRLNISARRV